MGSVLKVCCAGTTFPSVGAGPSLLPMLCTVWVKGMAGIESFRLSNLRTYSSFALTSSSMMVFCLASS